MGKKVKHKTKRVTEAPPDEDLEAEAAYYASRCGITRDEAVKIIRGAHEPKPSMARQGGAKGR